MILNVNSYIFFMYYDNLTYSGVGRGKFIFSFFSYSVQFNGIKLIRILTSMNSENVWHDGINFLKTKLTCWIGHFKSFIRKNLLLMNWKCCLFFKYGDLKLEIVIVF